MRNFSDQLSAAAVAELESDRFKLLERAPEVASLTAVVFQIDDTREQVGKVIKLTKRLPQGKLHLIAPRGHYHRPEIKEAEALPGKVYKLGWASAPDDIATYRPQALDVATEELGMAPVTPPRIDFGEISPPEERGSFKLQVMANCQYACNFCGLYEGRPPEVRPLEFVLRDIKVAAELYEVMARAVTAAKTKGETPAGKDAEFLETWDPLTRGMVREWVEHDKNSNRKKIFLHDGDALMMRTENLEQVLESLGEHFPGREITSYATVANILAQHRRGGLARLRLAGLTGVKVGIESGCDAVLEQIEAGFSKRENGPVKGKLGRSAEQIAAGQALHEVGLDFVSYIMPGIGGRALHASHIPETARVLNAIKPPRLGIRSLEILQGTTLYDEWKSGRFERLREDEIVQEIRDLIAALDETADIYVACDINNNLLPEVEGDIRVAKVRMLQMLDEYLLHTSEDDKFLFQCMRRMPEAEFRFGKLSVPSFETFKTLSEEDKERLLEFFMGQYESRRQLWGQCSFRGKMPEDIDAWDRFEFVQQFYWEGASQPRI